MSEPTVADKQNNPADPKALPETEPCGYRLQLRLENQEMECLADLVPNEQAAKSTPPADETGPLTTENNHPFPAEFLLPGSPTPRDLLIILAKLGIRQTIDFEALYLFCAAAEEGAKQLGVLLAKGVQPVAGTDVWFEMAIKNLEGDPEYREDEKGNVDLRSQLRHTEIEPGQKLGTVHAPQDGIAGMTANDLPMPAKQGKPFDLIAGKGVVLKYDDRVAFADKAGRALLSKQTLAVVDELLISGDLDLKVGNIDFHGFVEIRGDVPDDFLVKASKGMKIRGTVGACQLEAGGSVEIGSIAGKEVGQIQCHGDLKAGYLNQVNVACHGDILISNEIRNSQVKATGQIIVERGSIIGGKTLALEGIEAKVLGTTSCVRTQLVAGVYFPDAERLDYLRQRSEDINAQIKSIHAALGPSERLKERDDNLKSASKLRLTILNEHWEKLKTEKERVDSELAASRHQNLSCSNPKIKALTTIHEAVFVCLGQTSEKFKRDLSGPTTLIENSRQGGLRFLSLSPLSSQARMLEEEILQEEPAPEEQQPTAALKGSDE